MLLLGIRWLGAVGFAVLLSAGARAAESSGLPQFDESLFPSQLFWLVVTFGLLYVLMSCIALPRVEKIQATRQQVIASEVAAAKLAYDAAKATVMQSEKSLQEAHAKAQAEVRDMITKVTEESNHLKMIQENELLRHLRRVEADIAVARESALEAIPAHAADIGRAITDKVLGVKKTG